MATDFSYNGKTINISGPAKPSGKNQPLDPRTEVKLYADTAENDYIIVAVPASKNYTVTKDNGIGGKMAFDEETAGANGIDITINSVACKLYGEILLSQGEMFLYVD